MGSFLSSTSREKRRRSNRLSKPPSNKATLSSASSRHPPQLAENIVPVSSNPTVWQDPWIGTSIPISSSDIESIGERSRSFPSGPVHSETARILTSGIGLNQQITQNADELWPRSPTSPISPISPVSPTSRIHRTGSLYRQASIRPSRGSNFQPATLQNAPQSPIIDQPRRSFSVHSPPHRTPHRTRSTIHHTLEEATSSNTHFRVDSQGFSLIRRRSLLTRPGIATRRSTKEAIPRLSSSEASQDALFSTKHQSTSFATPPTPLSDREEFIGKPSFSSHQRRPHTPSDFEVEYSHLGTLKLGSLRIVNGSASPCSSDRTRLHRSGSSEVIQNAQQQTEIPNLAELQNREWETSPDSVRENMAHGNSLNKTEDERASIKNLNRDLETAGGDICAEQITFPTKPSATILRIPSSVDSSKHEDFPASPFSFEKSPTIATPHPMSIREAEDEGVSVSEDEKIFMPLPEKALERNLSHRKFWRSHRKVDSGYSSAASIRSRQGSHHRTSMDSQTSPQRTAGFRRFTLGGSSRDLEIYDLNAPLKSRNQLPINRHLSLQGPRMNSRYERSGWSASMSTMCHEASTNGRLRSSSLTIVETSNRMLPLPLYCSQLRNLEAPATGLPLSSISQTNSAGIGNLDGSKDWLYGVSDFHSLGRELHKADYTKATPVNHTGFQSYGDTGSNHRQNPVQVANSANIPQSLLKNTVPENLVTRVPSTREPELSGGTNPKIRTPRSGNCTLSMPTLGRRDKDVEISESELPRGRTRSRGIEYQRHGLHTKFS